MTSPLILVVAFVWIGFLVCIGMLFWSTLVKNSKQERQTRTLTAAKTPEEIMQHMADQEMEDRGRVFRERVQPMVPQIGLGTISLVLLLTIVFFSRGR